MRFDRAGAIGKWDARTALLGFFERSAEFTPFLGVETAEGSFIVSTGDRVVGRSLFTKRGRGEMAVLARATAILDSVQPAGWARKRLFVDVGANIGTSTISALLRHRFAGAVAAEPEPQNHRLLRTNLVLNDVDDLVTTVPAAVSDTSGSIELVLNPRNSGGHRVVPGGDNTWVPRPDLRIITVPTTTLDELVASGVVDATRVGLLWLDVQGHEAHVIAGARELLERGVPIVLEFHPTMLGASGGLERLTELLESNYEVFVDLRTVPPARGDSAPAAELSPTNRLRDLLDVYVDNKFTDLLVMRGI